MGSAWPLVGRAEELDVVLDALRRDDSRGIVVAGAIGVGKTRLVREAAAAVSGEVSIQWAVATPASASIPFGALAHLVPDVTVSSTDDRLRLLRGITSALVERAGGAPLVLAVDDAQWLDAGAAALVHQLAASATARVLLTLRTDEPAGDPIVSLWKDGLVERLEVQTLAFADVEAFVGSALDRPVDRPSVNRFWQLTQGNPLFLRELLLGAIETDAFEETDGILRWTGHFGSSTRLATILEDRLTRVGDAGRSVLEHLAVGEPVPLALLTDVCGADAVAAVERARLANVDHDADDAVRLSHPLYGEVIRAEMPTVERRRVMTRLADAFAVRASATRGDLMRIAAWRLESGTDAPVELFTEAAELANAVYDHTLAERLSRRAVAGGGGLRAALALGESLNRQGRAAEGLDVLAPLAQLARSDDEHLAVAVARYFGLTTEYGFRSEYEDVLLAAERQVESVAARDYLRAQRATLLCFAGRLDEGVRLAESLDTDEHDAPTRLRAVPALGGGWSTIGKPESACALSERMFPLALAHHDDVPQAPAWVLSTHLPALALTGRLDDADAAIDFVEAATAARGASADGPSFLAFARGTVALFRGQPQTAAKWLHEAVVGMRPIARWRLPYPLAYLVEACALIGDADGAIAALNEADEIVEYAQVFGGTVRRARGWAALARGQRSVAVDLFIEAAAWSAEHHQHTAQLFALHDAVRAGGGREPAELVAALAPRVEGRWATAFATHARGVLEDDTATLEESVDALEAMGARLHAAEAAAMTSASFARDGLRARADRLATRARVLAGECEGARSFVLADFETPLPLTAREREVAVLAAEGLSSQAIGERLFVSTRTVEGHLQRAYVKLGIDDRRDLRRLLGTS